MAFVTKHFFENIFTCGQGFGRCSRNSMSPFNTVEDPDLKDFTMPVSKERTVTDPVSLFVFIALLSGLVAVFVRSVTYGNTLVVSHGADSFGNFCGIRANEPIRDVDESGKDMTWFNKVLLSDYMRDPKRLLLSDYFEETTMPICVAECPLITESFDCLQYLSKNAAPYSNDTASKLCRSPIMDLSFFVRNRRCVPDVISSTQGTVRHQNVMLNLYGNHWIHNFLSDCRASSAEITWVALMAIAFSFLYIMVINLSADTACWFSFGMFFFVGISGVATMWYLYVVIKTTDTTSMAIEGKKVVRTDSDTDSYATVFKFFPRLSLQFVREQNQISNLKLKDLVLPNGTVIVDPLKLDSGYLDVFYLLTIVATTLYCLLLVTTVTLARRNVHTATSLFYEAACCLMSIKWIYFVPFVTLTFVLTITIFWLETLRYLASIYMADLSRTYDPLTTLTKISYVQDTAYVQYLLIFEFVGFYWLYHICVSCQNIAVSIVACTWYFTIGKTNLYKPLRVASTRLFRFHFGSAVCGAALIAFLGPIRAPFR